MHMSNSLSSLIFQSSVQTDTARSDSSDVANISYVFAEC